MVDLIFAARPMLLLPVWSIFLVTYHFLNPTADFDSRAFATLTGISLIMAGSHYINQIYDFSSDLINQKVGFLQSGLLTKSEIVAAYLSTSLIGLVIAMLLSPKLLAIAIIIALMGYFYSAPPMRLKDRPLWGLLANGAGYGIILPLTVPFAANFSYKSVAALMLYFFTTVSAIYLLTIIIDREGDNYLREKYSGDALFGQETYYSGGTVDIGGFNCSRFYASDSAVNFKHSFFNISCSHSRVTTKVKSAYGQ